MNETPNESVDRLRDLLRQRGPLTAAEQEAFRSAQMDIHGMAPNMEPLEDEDGNAFLGLFFAVLLMVVFASGVALGVAILYLLTR